MRLLDSIQQYYSIVFETSLGDNLISLQSRKDLSHLSSFLTKELGSSVVMKLQNEAAREADRQKKKPNDR